MNRMIKLYIFFVVLCRLHVCHGVIYQLNATEHEKLPRLFELDNYESCMEDPDAVYCVANLELYTDTPSEYYNFVQEYSAHTIKHYNYLTIDRGVCVTRKCKSYAEDFGLDIDRDLKVVLEGCLNETIRNDYNLSARLYGLHCEEAGKETSADKLDYIFLLIVIILIGLNITGTYYDSILTASKGEKHNITKGIELLLCFSLFQNMRALKTVGNSKTVPNIFKGLHGSRVIGTCIVVFAHVKLPIAVNFTANPHTFEMSFYSTAHRIALSGASIVQVFFFISGLLSAFILQTYSAAFNLTWKWIPKIVFQRWWRLTPLAAFVIGYTATWLRHISHGPLWTFLVTNGPTAQCRQHFWSHIFYVNNYVTEDKICVFPTWHIAADIQLFVVGLAIHFLIANRSYIFKIITLSLMVFVGAVINAMHVWLQDLDAYALQKPELARTMQDPTFEILHILGHNNLICFIIGMATGYLAYYLQEKNMKWSNFKIGSLFTWFGIPLITGIILLGGYHYDDGERASVVSRVIYAVFHKVAIGITCAIWTLGMVLDFNGCSSTLMECPGWVILSKLSYAVYLVHILIIHILLGIKTQLTPVCFFNMTLTFIGVLVLSYLIALPLYLFVEAPFNRIIKTVMNPKSEKRCLKAIDIQKPKSTQTSQKHPDKKRV